MFSNTTDFTKLFEESQRLDKIQKEQKLKKDLNKSADKGIANFRERLNSDVIKNSVRDSYYVGDLFVDYMHIDNTTCSEFKTIIKNKLIGLGFNRFELSEKMYTPLKKPYLCSVDISIEKKSE